MDVFCKCRWNFDGSDPEKDKSMFMACMLFCLWGMFPPKCVKIKRYQFLDEKVHQRWKCHLCCTEIVVYICLTSTINLWFICWASDLTYLGYGLKKNLFFLFVCILDILQLLRIHLSFHKYLFSCLISNNPIKNVCRHFCLIFHLTGYLFEARCCMLVR